MKNLHKISASIDLPIGVLNAIRKLHSSNYEYLTKFQYFKNSNTFMGWCELDQKWEDYSYVLDSSVDYIWSEVLYKPVEVLMEF